MQRYFLFVTVNKILQQFIVALTLALCLLLGSCAQENILAENTGNVSIDSIAPAIGPVGAQVRVYGRGFSPDAEANNVTVNGIKAKVLEPVSLGALLIEIPAGAQTGRVDVKVYDEEDRGPIFTVIDPPVIASVTPLQGFAGYTVVIRGSKFNQVTKVLFNGVEAHIQGRLDDVMEVTAPASTTGFIELAFEGGKVTGPIFTYLPIPLIEEVMPYSTIRIYWLLIVGRHFSTNVNVLNVYLNDMLIPVQVASLGVDGRSIAQVYHPDYDTPNPLNVVIESNGIKSLPKEYIITPEIGDYSQSLMFHTGNIKRYRIGIYGAWFGGYQAGKEVKFQHSTTGAIIPTTIVAWTPDIVTIEVSFDMTLVGPNDFYNNWIEIKGVRSNVNIFYP